MSGVSNAVRTVVAEWARANPKVRRVWVYGSRVKGTHRPDSDIDIAVELQPVGDSEETLAVWMAHCNQWQSELQARIGPTVVLEWFDPDGATTTIQATLDEASMLIYERAS